MKSCFPSSAAKPSSDLLDLQPDFSGAAVGAAAPVPPPAAGGATAWGGERVFRGCFHPGCYYYICTIISTVVLEVWWKMLRADQGIYWKESLHNVV